MSILDQAQAAIVERLPGMNLAEVIDGPKYMEPFYRNLYFGPKPGTVAFVFVIAKPPGRPLVIDPYCSQHLQAIATAVRTELEP